MGDVGPRMKRGLEGTQRGRTVPFSRAPDVRAAGTAAGDRVGGEGRRRGRIPAGSGGPWASAPPRAAPPAARSPGCAPGSRRLPVAALAAPAARTALAPPHPRFLNWGRSAPQRPAPDTAGTCGRWGREGPGAVPWLQAAPSWGRCPFPVRRVGLLLKSGREGGCGVVSCSGHGAPGGLLEGEGDWEEKTAPHPLVKWIFPYILSSFNWNGSVGYQQRRKKRIH